MKKLRLTSIIVCFCIAKTFAQCPSNVTHTDPNPSLNATNGGATPANGTFQQNTFDWTTQQFNQVYKTGGGFVTNSIQSLYYSGHIHAPFIKGTLSDFQPTSGWELIKQDFGYFYSGGGWNGSIMGENPNLLGDPRGDGSVLNYFILYNKYTALMRVFVFMPHSTVSLNANVINVQLSFLTAADYTGNTPAYSPSVNALFNHYNTACLALDKATTATVVSAPASFPATTSDFFYADFQLAYDPCLCLFQSSFEVDFYSIQTANFTFSGTYAGTNIPIADVSTTDQGTIFGAQSGDAFITSVFGSGANPSNAILSYNNAAAIVSADAAQQSDLNSLALGLSITSDIFDAADIAPLKATFDGLSKIASFYSSQATPSDAVKANAAITIEAGYLKGSGKIIDEQSTYNGFDGRIGVPGSLPPAALSTLPEYDGNPNTGQLPGYPMYNEVPGLFALLKTPKVNRFVYSPARPNTTSIGEITFYDATNNICTGIYYYGDQPYAVVGNNVTETVYPPQTTDYFVIEYNPTEDLVYALNPMVDVSKSKIYVSYEIDGMPNNTTHGNFGDHSLTGFENLLPLPSLPNSPFVRNKTPMYPIGCNTSVYTGEVLNYYQGESLCSPNNLCNNPDLPLINNIGNVRLVVILFLVTLPDAYGKTHLSTQIIKYDCDVNTTTTDFEASGTGAAGLTAMTSPPTDLQLNTNDPFGSSGDFFHKYSFGKITISASQDNGTGSAANIIAQTGIDIVGNVGDDVSITSDALHGGINLYTQELPPYFTACSNSGLSPLTSTNLAAYCTTGYLGNQYKANQAAKTASSLSSNTKNSPSVLAPNTTIVQTKLGTNIKLGIYPNPTSGLVYLNLSAQNAGALLVNITDVNGNQLMHNHFAANEGANSFKLDLSNLNSGVYFINITDENGVPIKNDKLVLMGQ